MICCIADYLPCPCWRSDVKIKAIITLISYPSCVSRSPCYVFSDKKETDKEEMHKGMRQKKGDSTRDNTGI